MTTINAGMAAALSGAPLTSRQAAALTPGMAAALVNTPYNNGVLAVDAQATTPTGSSVPASVAANLENQGLASVVPGIRAYVQSGGAFPALTDLSHIIQLNLTDVTGVPDPLPNFGSDGFCDLNLTNCGLHGVGTVGTQGTNLLGTLNTILADGNFLSAAAMETLLTAAIASLSLHLAYPDNVFASFANASSGTVGGVTCNTPPTGSPNPVNPYIGIFAGDCTVGGNGSFVVGNYINYYGGSGYNQKVTRAVFDGTNTTVTIEAVPDQTTFINGIDTYCTSPDMAPATSWDGSIGGQLCIGNGGPAGSGAIAQLVAATFGGNSISLPNCALSGLAGVVIPHNGYVTSTNYIFADGGPSSGTIGLLYSWRLTSGGPWTPTGPQLADVTSAGILTVMNAIGDGSGSNGQTGSIVYSTNGGTAWTTGGTPSGIQFTLVGGDQ